MPVSAKPVGGFGSKAVAAARPAGKCTRHDSPTSGKGKARGEYRTPDSGIFGAATASPSASAEQPHRCRKSIGSVRSTPPACGTGETNSSQEAATTPSSNCSTPRCGGFGPAACSSARRPSAPSPSSACSTPTAPPPAPDISDASAPRRISAAHRTPEASSGGRAAATAARGVGSSDRDRKHAQDHVVIPTAAARAMLGGSTRHMQGMVPVGRDVPIGLNIERFLGSANPFGQDPFKKSKEAALDDAQRIALLVGPSESMGRVLAARLSHLRVVGALWTSSGGPTKAIQHAVDMDDDAVLVDLLTGTQPKLHVHVGVELAQDLIPAVARLINSEYEDCARASPFRPVARARLCATNDSGSLTSSCERGALMHRPISGPGGGAVHPQSRRSRDARHRRGRTESGLLSRRAGLAPI